MDALEKSLGDIFVGKLWAFPEPWKEFIVKAAPWLSIIGVVLGLPAVLALVGIGAYATPFMMMGGAYGFARQSTIAIVFLVAILALEALSINGLFKRKHEGWRYAFWAVLVGGLQSLFTFDLGSLVIGTGLGLYILFQVRSRYH